MRANGWQLLLAAAWVASAGCARDGQLPLSENGGFVVDSMPFVDITGTERDTESVFGTPAGATELSSRLFVVGDLQTDVIRFFDDHGSLVRTSGREGAGPGEFQMVQWVQRCQPNEIFVWDRGQSKVTVVDTMGHYIRDFQIHGNPWLLACNRTGTLASLSVPRDVAMPTPDAPQLYSNLTILNARGDSIGGISHLPSLKNTALPANPSIAVGTHAVHFARGDTAVILSYDLHGRPDGIITVDLLPRQTTPEFFLAYVAKRILAVSGVAREQNRKLLLSLTPAKYLPVQRGLFVDPRDNLWLVTSVYGDSSTKLLAIDSRGRRLGGVRLPRDVDVFEIGDDYILGQREGRDGTSHVVGYKLRRTGTESPVGAAQRR